MTWPPAVFSAYAAGTGTPIVVETAAEVSSPDADVKVECAAQDRYRVRASRHGSYTLDIGGRGPDGGAVPSLEEEVRRRVSYITRYEWARERPGLLAHAFVPVDTRTGLTQATNGWADWTDGSERIAMPLLLQAAARGLTDAQEIGLIVGGWARFARPHLLDDSAAPRRSSQTWHTGPPPRHPVAGRLLRRPAPRSRPTGRPRPRRPHP